MRATIVPDDNQVLVDGVVAPVDCSALAAEGKHAIQWYGDYGEIEFVSTFNTETKMVSRKPNEVIDSIEPYQSYLDAWAIENAKQEAAAEERNKKMQEMMLKIKQNPLGSA